MIKSEIDLKPLMPLNRISAALLAHTASRFESRLTIEREGMVLNLKSMLGLLSQPNLGNGDALLVADGRDEKEATEAVLAVCKK